MVVSGHPLATAAGLHVLMDGGNAVDAAIAASAVLAVVRPAWCGLGGDGFALLYRPAAGVVALNGGGAAPLAVTPAAYPDGHVPLHGPRSVAVPGLVGAWELAASTHGSRSLGDLLQLAIQYARNGFVVDPAFGHAIEQIAPGLDHWPSLANLLVQDGHLLRAGDVLRQPSLAETLAVIATQGRQAFYRGTIALALVAEPRAPRGAANARRLRAAQYHLAGANLRAVPRVHRLRAAGRVAGIHPAPGAYDPRGLRRPLAGPADPELIDLLVRCKQAAFADAARYLPAVKGRGDAAAAADTLERLLSPKRAATWQTFIAARGPAAATLLATGGTDTDCLVVADGDGRLICWIQSLANPFGAREVCPTTGIILNDRLASLPSIPSSHTP